MRSHRQSALLFLSLFVTLWGTIPSGTVTAVAQSLEASQPDTTSPKSQAKLAQVSSKCAYDDRKTVETVKNIKGKVTLVGDNFVIVTEGNSGTRFIPCNLPAAFKTEGKVILVSGEVKEIYPTERWVATPFKITAITAASNPTPTQSIQSLANGDYKFCTKAPSASQGNTQGVDTGYCFVFSKRGNRLVGDFYDTRTLGEESVCVSGTLSNKTVRGEGIELVGDIGRQNPPANSQGSRMVNWDKPGYLKVARATQVGRPINNSRKIRYRTALLNLNGFYRYNETIKGAPTNCLKR